MTIHYLEIVTGDVDAVCAAYMATSGLQFAKPWSELGGARTAALPGGGTVGVRAPLHEAEEPTVRPYWLVDDVEAALDGAVETGAEVAHPPLEIPGTAPSPSICEAASSMDSGKSSERARAFASREASHAAPRGGVRASIVTALVMCLSASGGSSLAGQAAGFRALIDFDEGSGGEWAVVNDGVMGGRSSSSMRTSDRGTGVFEGDLSLENNGGFASVRTTLPEAALSGVSRLVLRVRGDGKRYQVRLRMSGAFDGIAYAASFDTVDDEWVRLELPLDAFQPTFRGYRPRNAPPLVPSEVRQIGIMLTDKQEGPFRLEIDWIGVDTGARSTNP